MQVYLLRKLVHGVTSVDPLFYVCTETRSNSRAPCLNSTKKSGRIPTITASGTSLVGVTGSATLAGTLEVNLDPAAANKTASYTILSSAGITGSFPSVTMTGTAPTSYSVSYLPVGAPSFVQLDIVGLTTPVRLQSFEVE